MCPATLPFGLLLLAVVPPSAASTPESRPPEARRLHLPAPRPSGSVPLEQALARRRSARRFSPAVVTLAELSQVLWAAQGITDPSDGARTAPSAGALYPLEVLVVATRVEDLAPGAWRYRPAHHQLERATPGRLGPALVDACHGQEWMTSAPAFVVVTGVPARTAAKYGARATRYVHVEAGCVAQNVALQATALGLGSVVVGAFDDDALARLLGLASGEQPVLVMPLGHVP